MQMVATQFSNGYIAVGVWDNRHIEPLDEYERVYTLPDFIVGPLGFAEPVPAPDWKAQQVVSWDAVLGLRTRQQRMVLAVCDVVRGFEGDVQDLRDEYDADHSGYWG